jgi:hypothetical protein
MRLFLVVDVVFLIMVGVGMLLTEMLSGQGVLHYWNIIQTVINVPPTY